jgi:hypothetical protein
MINIYALTNYYFLSDRVERQCFTKASPRTISGLQISLDLSVEIVLNENRIKYGKK